MTFLSFVFDYEFCLSIYERVNDYKPAFWTTQTIKAIAAVFLLINWYYKFLNVKNIKADNGDTSEVFNANDIIKGFALLFLIASYDYIFAKLDYLLSLIESETLSTGAMKQMYQFDQTDYEMEEDTDWTTALIDIAYYIKRIISDPFWIVLKVVEGICWCIDWLVYGLFVLERFFFMWMLKALGAIALAMYPFEKTKKYFWNWFGLYLAVFLLIIPYTMINYLTNVMYEVALDEMNISTTMNFDSDVMPTELTWYYPTALPAMFVLIITTILKFRLLTKSSQLVYKIFN